MMLRIDRAKRETEILERGETKHRLRSQESVGGILEGICLSLSFQVGLLMSLIMAMQLTPLKLSQGGLESQDWCEICFRMYLKSAAVWLES